MRSSRLWWRSANARGCRQRSSSRLEPTRWGRGRVGIPTRPRSLDGDDPTEEQMRQGARVRAILAALVGAAVAAPVSAQHPVENIDLMVRNLRDFGQPVIPIFEGWFPGTNGGYDVCFGYFNLNLKQERTAPLGPDNYVR